MKILPAVLDRLHELWPVGKIKESAETGTIEGVGDWVRGVLSSDAAMAGEKLAKAAAAVEPRVAAYLAAYHGLVEVLERLDTEEE